MSDEALVPPRPRITPVARPFWEALRRHRIEIQRCLACRRWVHYPRVRCPHCGAASLAFEPVGTTGTVVTFTVARQPTAPPYAAEVPQRLAIVELEDGVRLATTLVDEDLDGLACGDQVEAVFDDGDDGVTLLRFRRVRR